VYASIREWVYIYVYTYNYIFIHIYTSYLGCCILLFWMIFFVHFCVNFLVKIEKERGFKIYIIAASKSDTILCIQPFSKKYKSKVQKSLNKSLQHGRLFIPFSILFWLKSMSMWCKTIKFVDYFKTSDVYPNIDTFTPNKWICCMVQRSTIRTPSGCRNWKLKPQILLGMVFVIHAFMYK